MLTGYKWAAGVVVALFLVTAFASWRGWGLTSDGEALARAASVRGGSLGSRAFYGGGPGFGK